MAPKKYLMNLHISDGVKHTLLQVEGEQLHDPAYPNLLLFLHRSAKDKKYWTVSEFETGLAIVQDRRTRQEAIDAVRPLIESLGIEKVQAQIDEVIKRDGRINELLVPVPKKENKMKTTLYEQHLTAKSMVDASTLVAIQNQDNLIFMGQDALEAAEVLELEAHRYRISRGNTVPYLELPLADSSAIFKQLIDAGLTVTVAETVGNEAVTVEVAEAEEAVKEEAPEVSEVPEEKYAPPSTVQAICSICGRPLILPRSMAQGMGDVCASHAAQLGGMSLAEHRESVELKELTEDWIPLKEWFAYGNSKGITSHRLMQVAGGDRALRKPLHPSFAVKYYKGRRYVHRSALMNIEAARLK